VLESASSGDGEEADEVPHAHIIGGFAATIS
jgi:hypothetical protein